MVDSRAPRHFLGALLCGSVLAGCSPRVLLSTEGSDRTPLNADSYSLTMDYCGPNPEPLLGGAEDVPAGDGFLYDLTLTNREDSARRFQVRVTIVDPSDPNTSHQLAPNDTPRVEPNESVSVVADGWVAATYRDGFNCEIEVWPSLTDVVDP